MIRVPRMVQIEADDEPVEVLVECHDTDWGDRADLYVIAAVAGPGTHGDRVFEVWIDEMEYPVTAVSETSITVSRYGQSLRGQEGLLPGEYEQGIAALEAGWASTPPIDRARRALDTVDEAITTCVAGIVADLRGRSGLDGAWDAIDASIQAEIVEEWTELVRDACSDSYAAGHNRGRVR